MKRNRRPIWVLALALTAALLPAAPVGAAIGKGCTTADAMMEYITPVTMHVEIKSFPKQYKVGDVVKVKVEVTRPAEEDPAGLGVAFDRPMTQPAEDVNVGVGISIGRTFLPGYGLTKADGKTTVMIKLEKYVPAAMAHVRAFAYKEIVYTTCLIVEEQGYRDRPNAFKVVK